MPSQGLLWVNLGSIFWNAAVTSKWFCPQVDGIARTYQGSFANSRQLTEQFFSGRGIYYAVYDNLWYALLGAPENKEVQKQFPLAVHPVDMHAKGCPFRPVALNHSTAPGSFSCRKHNAKSSMACGSSCEICCKTHGMFVQMPCWLGCEFPEKIIFSNANMSWSSSSTAHLGLHKFQNKLHLTMAICKTPVEFPFWTIYFPNRAQMFVLFFTNTSGPLLSSACPIELLPMSPNPLSINLMSSCQPDN